MPTLYVVATPIGNLSDISPRALETLQKVSLIAAEDTSHTIKLLNHFEIKTHMISYHKYNESERASAIISKMLTEDIDVAIVPVGGGGLISGVAYALKTLKPSVKIYGVQAGGAPSMYNAVKTGVPESFPLFPHLPTVSQLKPPAKTHLNTAKNTLTK